MSFWRELKRRNVFKVGAAYAIVAWLILQVAAITFPVLHLPGWALTLVTVLLIIGFPLILLFAWAFEITPDGIKRTEHVPLAESITHLTGQKLNYIVTGLLVVAMVFVLFKVNTNDRDALEPDLSRLEAEKAPGNIDIEGAPKTIAVLPFVNRSPDPEQGGFVDGLSEEIINCISRIADLSVTSSTSCFAFKDSGKTIQEVADVLGVAYILEGSVRKSGDELRITAQLIRASDDVHIWSETYDSELKDIFTVQEVIATAVASGLKVKLGIGQSFKQLGGTDNTEAYEHYLFAKGHHRPGELSTFDRAIESIDAAIELDPDFALAYAEKAIIHLGIASVSSADRAGMEQEEALNALRKAIDLEPNSAEVYAVLGLYRLIKGDFIAAESAIRKALELQPLQGITVDVVLLHHLAVGRPGRIKDIFEETLRKDPLNPTVSLFYLFYLGQTGDIERVEKEYERFKLFHGDQWQAAKWHVTFIRFGRGDILSPDDILVSGEIGEIIKRNLDSPEEGIAELRRIYTDDNQLSITEMIVLSAGAAYFNHPEFAFEVLEKVISYDALDTLWVWCPVFHEARQLPRFKEFVKEIGLVDYWNEFGWPDICRPLENGDFVCD